MDKWFMYLQDCGGYELEDIGPMTIVPFDDGGNALEFLHKCAHTKFLNGTKYQEYTDAGIWKARWDTELHQWVFSEDDVLMTQVTRMNEMVRR